MAICNRDLDVSQQKVALSDRFGALATGLTLPVMSIASPANLIAAKLGAFGISGTPTALLSIQRFIVGSGVTSFLGGITTLTLQAEGTSGMQSAVIAAAGSTALQLQAGDIVMLTTGGANSAVTGLEVSLVVQYTQDIKSYYGA